MAYSSTIDPENCIHVGEVHYSEECKMVGKSYKLHGIKVFIFVRKCVCNEYENKCEIVLTYDNLDEDGVFIHFYKDCFRQREEYTGTRMSYIHESLCKCAYEYEQISNQH